MQNLNAVKCAVNSMINAYQSIKKTHYFYHDADKFIVVKDEVNTALLAHSAVLQSILESDVHESVKIDLVRFKMWLQDLKAQYHTYIDIADIPFTCIYSLPQSGMDCIYLSYQDSVNDNVYLNLYDAN